jgi:hypothetical protein
VTPGGMSDGAATAKLEGLFKKARGGEEPPPKKPTVEPTPTGEAPKASETDEPDASETDEADESDDVGDAVAEARKAREGDAEEAEGEAPEGSPAAVGDVDFEWEGKVYKVPKPLVEGAMRQADYSRKTQEVAAVRKQVAAEKLLIQTDGAAMQELAPAYAELQNIGQQIEALRGSLPDPAVDPVAYLQHDKRVRDLEAAGAKLQSAVAQRRTELARQKQSALAELLQTGTAILSREIPGFNGEVRNEIGKFAIAEGYAPEELQQVYDPRFIKLAYKAMQYDKLQRSRPAVQKKIADAPPVVRPSAVVNQANTVRAKASEAVDRARKSGTTQDAESAMLALLRASKSRRR